MSSPSDDADVQRLLRFRSRRGWVLLLVGLSLWTTAIAAVALTVTREHDLEKHGVHVAGTVTGVSSERLGAVVEVHYVVAGHGYSEEVGSPSEQAHPVGSAVDLLVDPQHPERVQLADHANTVTGWERVAVVTPGVGLLPVAFGWIGVVRTRRLRRLATACGPWWEGTLKSAQGSFAIVTGSDGRAVSVVSRDGSWDLAWSHKHLHVATLPDHSAGLVRLDRTWDPRWLRRVTFEGSPHRAMLLDTE